MYPNTPATVHINNNRLLGLFVDSWSDDGSKKISHVGLKGSLKCGISRLVSIQDKAYVACLNIINLGGLRIDSCQTVTSIESTNRCIALGVAVAISIGTDAVVF